MKYYTIRFTATRQRRPCFIVTTGRDAKQAARAAAAIAGREITEILAIHQTGQR